MATDYMRSGGCIAAVLVVAFGHPGVAAVPGERSLSESECQVIHSVTIPRLAAPKRVTTDLSQPPWNRAARLTGFVDLKHDAFAVQPTWVYLFYDRTSLWVAFRCEGQAGTALKTEITERDGRVWVDDCVELHCDPTHSHREAFHFLINAAGVIYDAQNMDKAWNGPIEVETAKDDSGWTTVMSAPFRTLKRKVPKVGEVWAVNFCRDSSVPERSSWTPTLGDFVSTERFGHIVFGGERVEPVRLNRVPPISVGASVLELEAPAGTRCEYVGRDDVGRIIAPAQHVAFKDGKIPVVLDSDAVRRVDIELSDARGGTLACGSYPMQSPRVLPRLKVVQQRIKRIEETLARFPADMRGNVESLPGGLRPAIAEAEQIAKKPAEATADRWQRLDQIVSEAEMKLRGPGEYAETLALFPKAGFAVGFERPARKVMIRDFVFPGWFAERYDLSLARGEHEGLQVVVMPYARDLKNVRVSVSAPAEAREARPMPGGKVEVSLVGHVDVADHPPYEASYHGWWPDALLSFQKSCEVRQGEHVAFWIDVATEAATPAGDYRSEITVTADECEPIKLRLDVRVWDFELPRTGHLPTAFTFNRPMVAGFYRKQGWDETLHYKFLDMILDHRLNIDHLYRGEPPDLGLMRYGVERGMNAFNLLCTGRGGDKEGILKVLDEIVPRLKREGLFKYAYVYGFDEVHEEHFDNMRKVFGAIRERYPGLRTMTTAQDRSFGQKTGLRDVVDVWVPLTPSFRTAEAEKLRAEGKDMWWYVCVVPRPPYANWFVESPAIEARLLTGTMSYKYKAGGFLYYLIDQWEGNHKPIGGGPMTEWNPGTFTNARNETANGDGCLILPGPDRPVATIRLENIRDGLEDYEYLYLLAERARQIRELPASAERQAYLKKADALLAVPDALIANVREYTHDPEELHAFRDEVAAAIIEAGWLAAPPGSSR